MRGEWPVYPGPEPEQLAAVELLPADELHQVEWSSGAGHRGAEQHVKGTGDAIVLHRERSDGAAAGS
jgi:hypothetical protein